MPSSPPPLPLPLPPPPFLLLPSCPRVAVFVLAYIFYYFHSISSFPFISFHFISYDVYVCIWKLSSPGQQWSTKFQRSTVKQQQNGKSCYAVCAVLFCTLLYSVLCTVLCRRSLTLSIHNQTMLHKRLRLRLRLHIYIYICLLLYNISNIYIYLK